MEQPEGIFISQNSPIIAGDKKITQKKTPYHSYTQHPRSRPLWPLDDEELARRAQKGSDDAFTELVLRYGGRLYAFLIQKNISSHDAEDLVQETFIKVYKNLHHYRSQSKFSPWIYTIATRLAVSWFRSRPRAQIPLIEEPISEKSVDFLEQQEQVKNLWRLVRIP